VPQPFGDDLHRFTVRQEKRGVCVPQVVQPDRRDPVVAQGALRPLEVTEETPREPLRVTVVAFEVTEHDSSAADQFRGESASYRPMSTQAFHGAGVEVDDPSLASLGRTFHQLLALPFVLHQAHAAPHGDAGGL
jgi:hypothetical protein